MREIRRIAIKAERTGKFNRPLHKALSVSFFLRRLPTVFFPPKEDVAGARKLSGKGYFRQVLERLILLTLFRMEPSDYYICGLFMPEQYAAAGAYIDYRQISFLNFFLNQKKTTIQTEDKIQFAELCAQKGLRTAPLITRLNPQTPLSEKDLEEKLRPTAKAEGVFFKARFGMQGFGAGRLTCNVNDTWLLIYATGGRFEGNWAETYKIIKENCNEELIFQPVLKSHQDVLKFNPNSIQSVRFITFRDRDTIRPLLARLI